jgi:hypothetical protein
MDDRDHAADDWLCHNHLLDLRAALASQTGPGRGVYNRFD